MICHLLLCSQVIGAVLNSFGIGSQTTNTAAGGAQPNTEVTIVLSSVNWLFYLLIHRL